LQGSFWEIHNTLFRRQKALDDDDLRRYATELGLDVERFDVERRSEPAVERIERDIRSAIASRGVVGTPTLFIDGVLHSGGYDAETLLRVVRS
jgi:protein-disulfide isomerase